MVAFFNSTYQLYIQMKETSGVVFFFLINKLALMEVINANCLAREAGFFIPSWHSIKNIVALSL